jgi:hypothetical protein
LPCLSNFAILRFQAVVYIYSGKEGDSHHAFALYPLFETSIKDQDSLLTNTPLQHFYSSTYTPFPPLTATRQGHLQQCCVQVEGESLQAGAAKSCFTFWTFSPPLNEQCNPDIPHFYTSI